MSFVAAGLALLIFALIAYFIRHDAQCDGDVRDAWGALLIGAALALAIVASHFVPWPSFW